MAARDPRGRVRTVRRRIDAIRGATYNPRQITEKARGALAASLGRFGLVQPVVVNKRSAGKGWPKGAEETIVGGHQRVAVLDEQGVEEIDVVLVDLDETDEKALNVALNSRRLSGDFTEGLGALLQDIKLRAPELHSALLMPGMKAPAAKGAGAGASLSAIDESALQRKPRTRVKPGDVWALGEHRLACGDATDPDVIERVMGGALADVVHTDPPYGVDYEAAGFDRIAGDDLKRDDLVALVKGALILAARHSVDAAAFYVWHATWGTREDLYFALKAAGLEERQYLIWAKPSAVLSRCDYHPAHEGCFYACKAGHSPRWHGDRTQQTLWRLAASTDTGRAVVLGPGLVVSDGDGGELTLLARTPARKLRSVRCANGSDLVVAGEDASATVWEISRDRGPPIHPTQKPVAIPARAIANSSAPGGRVLDPFAGSGSTLIAAEQLGRIAHVVELSPRYCDEIVARWEQLTGSKAKKEAAKPNAKNG